MRYLVKPVLALSAFGFLLSLVAHVSARAGTDLKLGNGVFVLHGGIFLVWLPAMLIAMRLGRGKAGTWGFGFSSWKQVLSGCPRWMTYLLIALFAYVFLNFFLFMGKVQPQSSPTDPASPEVIRGFSGHWLLFYYAAFAIAYSAFKKPELLANATCSKGHRALPTDKFCSECGSPVAVAKVG